MAFFIQISFFWILLWIISKFLFKEVLRSHALKGRLAFSAGFIIIGLVHLVNPESLAYMIKGLLPYPTALVIVTGIMEIGLGILLNVKKWQKRAGWIIIIYLIAIFPANINVAIHNLNPPGGLPATPFYIWSRLLFQPVYILWVYVCAVKPRLIHKEDVRREGIAARPSMEEPLGNR